MPRRLLGVFMLLLASVTSVRAQGDAVLLTVGGGKVSKGEFEYHFSKSSEKRADVFVETYARFKQKVQCARELGLDTLSGYRDRKEALVKMKRRQADEKADKASSWQTPREWVKVLYVTWPLKQEDGKAGELRGKHLLDSLYREFCGKGIPAEWVKELPWVQTRHLLDEWQCRLESLERNEFSEPFCSPLGVHMIAWKDKSIGRWLHNGKKAETARFRMKEIEEAYLLVALEEYLQHAVVCSEQDLEALFQSQGELYGRGVPHYRGAVVHARHKKAAKAVKRFLKKYPEALWQEAVKRMPDKLKQECQVEVGLFPIGENPYVDKLVFGCGDFSPLPDYPYTWVMGKTLKKGPDDYREVRQKLEQDCMEAKKKVYIEGFTQKYAIEIDKEVLKTVNRAEIK